MTTPEWRIQLAPIIESAQRVTALKIIVLSPIVTLSPMLVLEYIFTLLPILQCAPIEVKAPIYTFSPKVEEELINTGSSMPTLVAIRI